MSRDPALSVLIPAWDEEQAIGHVVREVLAGCRRAAVPAECLVAVDPRTTDRTAEVAGRAGARAVGQRSHGLTAAVLELADLAAGPVCVVMDGDGQHDGTVVPALAGPVVTGELDLVTGGRDPDSLRAGFPAGLRGTVRYIGARQLAFAARTALRQEIADPLTGMFACNRQDLLSLTDLSRTAPPGGYKLLLGLLAMLPAGRTCHMTVPFRARSGGDSKLGFRVILTTLRQLVVLWRLNGSCPRWLLRVSRKSPFRVADDSCLT